MPLSIPLVVGRMAERCTWRFSCRCRYHLSSGEWPKDAPGDFHAAVDTTCRRENDRKMHLEIFMPLSIPLVVGRMAERCTWRFSCRCRYHLSSGEWPKDTLAWCQHMIHHVPPGLMPAHGMPFAHLLDKCKGEPNPQREYQDSERDPILRD